MKADIRGFFDKEIMDSYIVYSELFDKTLDDLLTSLDMDENDVKENAQKMVKQYLISKEICEREKIALQGDSFEKCTLEYIKDFGYETIEEFENDCGEEYLRREVIISIAKQFIFSQAQC